MVVKGWHKSQATLTINLAEAENGITHYAFDNDTYQKHNVFFIFSCY